MNLPEDLYHYTLSENLESIMKEGLIPGKGHSSISPIINDPNNIWLDSFYYSPPSKGCAILVIDSSKLDPTKLTPVSYQKEWFKYAGTIPPEYIELAEQA